MGKGARFSSSRYIVPQALQPTMSVTLYFLVSTLAAQLPLKAGREPSHLDTRTFKNYCRDSVSKFPANSVYRPAAADIAFGFSVVAIIGYMSCDAGHVGRHAGNSVNQIIESISPPLLICIQTNSGGGGYDPRLIRNGFTVYVHTRQRNVYPRQSSISGTINLSS